MPADPVATGRDLRELGYYFGVSQTITPYMQVGLRYDFYDPDADRQEQRGPLRVPVSVAFATLAVTAAVQHPRYGRAQEADAAVEPTGQPRTADGRGSAHPAWHCARGAKAMACR